MFLSRNHFSIYGHCDLDPPATKSNLTCNLRWYTCVPKIVKICEVFHCPSTVSCPGNNFKLQHENFDVRYISLSKSAVHKNRNPASWNSEVIALCIFLYFELCLGHNSETTSHIKKKLCR